MRVAADEGGELRKSSDELRSELVAAEAQVSQLKEELYKAQHELEWRTSAVRQAVRSVAPVRIPTRFVCFALCHTAVEQPTGI